MATAEGTDTEAEGGLAAAPGPEVAEEAEGAASETAEENGLLLAAGEAVLAGIGSMLPQTDESSAGGSRSGQHASMPACQHTCLQLLLIVAAIPDR